MPVPTTLVGDAGLTRADAEDAAQDARANLTILALIHRPWEMLGELPGQDAQHVCAKLTIFGKAVSPEISRLVSPYSLLILSPNSFLALSPARGLATDAQRARPHYLLAGLAQQRPSAAFAWFLQAHNERR